MKIAFFGTSEFGTRTLEKLYTNFSVEFIVTGCAKPANRGHKIINTPIFETASKLGIARIYTPQKLTEEYEEYLKDIDYGIVVSYGKILPEKILRSVKQIFINLHPSSLPLFRGAAPIERTLEAGFIETNICAIKMVKELDAGPILGQEHYKILAEDDANTLHQKFGEIGSDLIVNLLKNGIQDEQEQEHLRATYAKKITKDELELKQNTNQTQIEVINKIRAFTSYGYCFLFLKDKRFKIIEAKASHIKQTPLDIQCSDGFVSPIIIRPEGKGNIKIEEYTFN